MPDLIPLDKLISRLRTDLKLSTNYANKYGEPSSHEVKRKNKQKLSLLYYLERLREVRPAWFVSKDRSNLFVII